MCGILCKSEKLKLIYMFINKGMVALADVAQRIELQPVN